MAAKKKKQGAAKQPTPRQLTPTTLWYLSANNVLFAKVVSLGTYSMTTNPPFSWQANKEHWFVMSSITDLRSLLSAAPSVVASIYYRCSGAQPDSFFIQQAGQISLERFQFYAKSVLGTGDWVSGSPPGYSNNHYYFVASGTGTTRPRMLFDISNATPGNIARVSWVTQDRYSGFSGGFTAPSASMSWPSPCYHYPTQHP